MASERRQQILIVEDDLDLSEMLSAYFGVQGYKVATVAWGKEAVKLCQEKPPDLVILDIRLPDIDGYEVARQLGAQHRTKDVPIIFLTERQDRLDKLAGLEMGVCDYITKPFDIQEVRLRVRNILRRASHRQVMDNAVTGLPEGALVDERLEKLLKDKNPWALLVVRLRGLSHFHERYGFVASDDVLRAVSVMLNNALEETGEEGKDDFIGHLEQEVFVLVTGEKRLEPLRKRIQERVGSSMEYFYPVQDRDSEDKSKDKDRDKDKKKERLGLQIGSLRSSDGPFKSMEALKEATLKAWEKA